MIKIEKYVGNNWVTTRYIINVPIFYWIMSQIFIYINTINTFTLYIPRNFKSYKQIIY